MQSIIHTTLDISNPCSGAILEVIRVWMNIGNAIHLWMAEENASYVFNGLIFFTRFTRNFTRNMVNIKNVNNELLGKTFYRN